MELYLLVIYDISDDELRLKVADFLKAQGLKRIQKSAFIGYVTPSTIRNIEAGLRRLIKGYSRVNIQLFTLTQTCYNSRIIIGDLKYEEESEDIVLT